MHHEVLVVVGDAPPVLGRFPIRRLTQRLQEVGVPAPQRHAHRAVRGEDLALLEVFGGGVHVRLRPCVRIGRLRNLVAKQHFQHFRSAVVAPRPEMV